MVFIAAVALVLRIRFGVDAGYFLVVLVNYGLHVVHTTVADLDVVSCRFAIHSVRSSMLRLAAMFLASLLMLMMVLSFAVFIVRGKHS